MLLKWSIHFSIVPNVPVYTRVQQHRNGQILEWAGNTKEGGLQTYIYLCTAVDHPLATQGRHIVAYFPLGTSKKKRK